MRAIIFLFMLLDASALFACSCRKLSKIEQQTISDAGNIFIGKVTSIEPAGTNSRKICFQMTERLKTDSIYEISIMTALGGADCGLTITVGLEWYVFTQEYQGRSWAGICGRSALLSAPSIVYSRYGKKQYRKNKARAKREIRFIRRVNNNGK